MANEKLRRYAWQRTTRPRNWGPYMCVGSRIASHSALKTGGFRSVRAHIHEIRAREAETLTVNSQLDDEVYENV